MPGEADKDRLTRRGFLGVGSAALAAAGMLSATNVLGQEQETPQKAKTDRSASDPGPTNSALDAANPDPREVVAKTFGVSQQALQKMPTKELFAHLHLDKATLDALPREKPVIMPE